MRRSRYFAGRFAAAAAILAAAGALIPTPGQAGQDFKFTTKQEAFAQGYSAYRNGYYLIALPSLSYAASKNDFLAQYYLARIYADPASVHTNHGKAYKLYFKIVHNRAEEIDPEADRRAGYVAEALTAVARYLMQGIPEIGLLRSPARATTYLGIAAKTYQYQDAQFEFAKLRLKGEGVPRDIYEAKHFLWALIEKHHAGAQAFMARLMWKGDHVTKDRKRALALVTVAVENAPDHDRIWIEDTYQSIFCGTPKGIREQATGYVASFKKQYGQPRRRSLAGNVSSPDRDCTGGEPVAPIERFGARRPPAPVIAKRPGPRAILKGSTGGFSFGNSGSGDR